MRPKKIISALIIVSVLVSVTACKEKEVVTIHKEKELVEQKTTAGQQGATTTQKEETTVGQQETASQKQEDSSVNNNIFYIKTSGRRISATFENNSSADAFRELLKAGDVTVSMSDYGNFEKVGNLGTTLVRNDEQITTVPGDVILYQGNSITIYYDTNSWNLTRLGRIEGATTKSMKDFLGEGKIEVVFSLNE